MFRLAVIFAALVVAACVAQQQLPPGVDPTVCTSYPNCPIPYVLPVAPQVPVQAPRAPAGVDLRLCPGYPICDNVAAHNPTKVGGVFPADVDPTNCIGYPFYQCK